MLTNAQKVLRNPDMNIIVTGITGSGKSTMITSAKIPDAKYFHFAELNNYKDYTDLTEENFSEYNFLDTPEKTLILDAVNIPQTMSNSKIINLFKIARQHNKRLIVVVHPSQVDKIRPLFNAVISLNDGFIDVERA